MVTDSDLSRVAEAAVSKLFERMGIDVTDRDEMRALGRDLTFLRGMREGAEEQARLARTQAAARPGDIRKAAIEKTVTFLLGLLFAYVLYRLGIKS